MLPRDIAIRLTYALTRLEGIEPEIQGLLNHHHTLMDTQVIAHACHRRAVAEVQIILRELLRAHLVNERGGRAAEATGVQNTRMEVEMYSDRKYMVLREDGSRPEWPWFVLNLNDDGGYVAFQAYVAHYEALPDVDHGYLVFLQDVLSGAEEYMEGKERSRPDVPSARERSPQPPHDVVMALFDGAKDVTVALLVALPKMVARAQIARARRLGRGLLHALLIG